MSAIGKRLSGVGRRVGRRLLGWNLRAPRVVRIDDADLSEYGAAERVAAIQLSEPTTVAQRASSPGRATVGSPPRIAAAAVESTRWASGVTALEQLPQARGGLRSWMGRDTAQQRSQQHGMLALLPLLIDARLVARSYGPLRLPHPLYRFQREGVDFLLDTRPGALLADDMGLGKTVQAIVALRSLFASGGAERALIAAPKAVVTSWQRHLAEWAPELRTQVVVGPAGERAARWRQLAGGGFDIGVATYDSIRSDLGGSAAGALRFDVVVADEVHYLKNPKTQRTRVLRSLQAGRRWGLSGTPLENSVAELAAVLRFLDPKYPDLTASGGRPGGRRGTREERDRALRERVGRVKRSAERVTLRRRKGQVLDQLPKLVSNIEYVSLTSRQRQAYQRAERDGISTLRGTPRNITNVLAPDYAAQADL